jgi:hypothetical protein
MLCLPTLSLGMLFAAFILAQIINRDMHRLPMTFLFGLLSLGIVHAGCAAGGDAAGWVAFAGFIALIVLIMLSQAGVFIKSPSVLPKKCIPLSKKYEDNKSKCEPPCPLCPGDEPCPIPDYLPE